MLLTAGDEEAGPAETRLRTSLDARVRRWCMYEFFCSALDRPWLTGCELRDWLQHVGIDPATVRAPGACVLHGLLLLLPRAQPALRMLLAPGGMHGQARGACAVQRVGAVSVGGSWSAVRMHCNHACMPQRVHPAVLTPEEVLQKLTRLEWVAIRSTLGKPRRLSLAFLQEVLAHALRTQLAPLSQGVCR